MDISEIRYNNYKFLFEQFKELVRRSDPEAPEKGMLQLFAEKAGIPIGYMSHINTRYKQIGPKNARKIEEAFNLPHGWVDQIHDDKKSRTTTQTQESPAPQSVDPDELAFLETAVQLYRSDPIAAQSALMRLLASKLKS